MSGKKRPTEPETDDDAIPDLSEPEWRARFDAAPVRRGDRIDAVLKAAKP